MMKEALPMPSKLTPRFKKPGATDPRLLIGVFIVVLSLLGVLGIIRATNQTEPFYALTADVGIGETITTQNLTVVDARLAGSSEQYISADQPIAPGTVAKRPLVSGELLAAAAVTTDLKEGRRLVTLLKDQYAVADFQAGDRVDIWVASKVEGSNTYNEPRAIAEGAEIHSVTPQESIIGGTGQSAVELWVESDLLSPVLAASSDGSVINIVPSTYKAGQ